MPSSRRAVLGACAAAVVPLAGCGESPDRDDPPTTRRRNRTPAEAETRRLRYDGERLVASGSTENEDERPDPVLLVTSDAERDALRYRSEPDGRRELEAFVDDTDLSESTLLVYQASIGECYRRRLVSARRDADRLDVELCRQLRPATVACDREAEVVEVLAARLPFAVEEVSSYSLGSGGGCEFGITTEGQG